jgi:hypothetical protein
MSVIPVNRFANRFCFLLSTLLAVVGLSACSAVDVVPAETDTFVATGYTRYAWRSEPPSQTGAARNMLADKSPLIRAGAEDRLSRLGYQRVDRADAEFLIEYMAAPGLSEGQLSRGGSNESLYASSVNRQVDGASIDNAQALSGAVETGEIALVFIDAKTSKVLWRVQMTMVVKDVNRVNEADVRNAVRRGLSTLPSAS